jgi:hypothetical protein
MNHESETATPQTASLSKDTVEDWISICKTNGKEGKFIRLQIGRALEHKDPIALKFLEMAHEIDPYFVKMGFFRSFMDLLKSQ